MDRKRRNMIKNSAAKSAGVTIFISDMIFGSDDHPNAKIDFKLGDEY